VKASSPSNATSSRSAATGTRKTHIAIGFARACIRAVARDRFHHVVDVVDKLEAEARAGRQGRIADHLCRLDSSCSTNSASPTPAATCSSTSSAVRIDNVRRSAPVGQHPLHLRRKVGALGLTRRSPGSRAESHLLMLLI
jgi:hypothetical protein